MRRDGMRGPGVEAVAPDRTVKSIEFMSTLDGRILVTGGAGFIGSALIWALNQRGHTDIVVTDFLSSDEKWRNLLPLKFADYCDAATFRNWVRRNPDCQNA